jgi:DNA-directed RNA polymerase specialized sigma24 family protein
LKKPTEAHPFSPGELEELVCAYREFADRLEQHRLAAKALGMPETTPPDPPGPRELARLRRGCLALASTKGLYLPERIRREVPVDPEKLVVIAARRQRDSVSVVERGLTGVWPQRPSKGLSQEQWEQLMAVLGTLAPREHEAYILVKGRGLSHRQAALEMGIDAGNVYNLLRRAEEKVLEWRAGQGAQGRLPI